jgi:5-methylcytosine-specific restriction protein A
MPTINKKQKKQPWSVVTKAFQRSRFKDDSKLYNSSQWRKDSKAHKQDNPLCAICLLEGMAVDAVVSDHIIPINEGGEVWSWSNRQALCLACHAIKSREEGMRARRRVQNFKTLKNDQ